MSVTRVKDLNTLDEENVEVVFGFDWGRAKLIATVAVVSPMVSNTSPRR